jgi:hypothetical protein
MKRLMLGIAFAAMSCTALAAEKLPSPDRFLFWTPAEQALGYRHIEKIFPTRTIRRAGPVRALGPGPTTSRAGAGTRPPS